MTEGNTHAIAQHLDEREDWDALQEVKAELEQAEARIAELEAKLSESEALLAKAVDEAEDWKDCLNNWFDTKKLAEEHVDPKIVDAAAGYLRVSRVGGMDSEESDLVLGVVQDMAFRGVFSSIFTQYTLAELKGETGEG